MLLPVRLQLAALLSEPLLRQQVQQQLKPQGICCEGLLVLDVLTNSSDMLATRVCIGNPLGIHQHCTALDSSQTH